MPQASAQESREQAGFQPPPRTHRYLEQCALHNLAQQPLLFSRLGVWWGEVQGEKKFSWMRDKERSQPCPDACGSLDEGKEQEAVRPGSSE